MNPPGPVGRSRYEVIREAAPRGRYEGKRRSWEIKQCPDSPFLRSTPRTQEPAGAEDELPYAQCGGCSVTEKRGGRGRSVN